MKHPNRPYPSAALALALLALALAGCTTGTPELVTGPSLPPAPQAQDPAFHAHDIVGRWSFALYLEDEDRARTVLEAAKHCERPHEITLGPTGGVMMRVGSREKPEELRLKGGPGGKTYIGPDGPPGGWLDLEVISFTGRVLILRWADPKVRNRYGTMVYVRCPSDGAKLKVKQKREPQPKL